MGIPEIAKEEGDKIGNWKKDLEVISVRKDKEEEEKSSGVKLIGFSISQ